MSASVYIRYCLMLVSRIQQLYKFHTLIILSDLRGEE